jgi:1,4-dihydroxy-2-naphthoyl-CoA hydrolase
MPFEHTRIIRFQDTDAAGVLYFANLLAICHEAYEASLAASGIDLKGFFRNPDAAIPIAHARVDFFAPLFCGDEVAIALTPTLLKAHTFEIEYRVFPTAASTEGAIGRAVTKHVCIHPASRQKQPLAPEIMKWLLQWAE